jgi:hypothetical protein
MSFGSIALHIMGLSSYVSEAKTVIEAGKDGKAIFDSAKELFESEAGKKFRDKVVEVLQVSHPKPDGSVFIGGAEHPKPPEPEMIWAWVGGLEGIRWVSRDEAVKNGWPEYEVAK